ncbi:MAG TPA: cytochrome C [Bdellovibrionales bacterium]|nr:MAG: hypothetical protein A2Z97_15695 [Bdellovibrionales bacterium GWB1_52_6]OFZ02932.1 MAG: hypothetical protein A2X97_05000 [Bdellovibrionales bacterium GWA1_52_35]OFZ42498.1 MAG: hypothetical protein A2070_00145 [Bdellovibrionales bacterium GWC1_52_8]HAR43996.1 cytochrome C [Bdellovibrionales bacterium]HCM38517.1 cytochrome C [Bdellovibrionales bacterium]
MKLVLIAAGLMVSTLGIAADSPDSVTLKSKYGNITFNHKVHGQSMSCSACHGETIGPLAPLGKDRGHAICLDCHKKGGEGPTRCGDCHKK